MYEKYVRIGVILFATCLMGSGVVLPDLAHADDVLIQYWTHQFGAISGNSLFDFALAVDSTGGAYVVGSIDGTLPGQTTNGQRDAFIRKYSSAGDVLWTDQFGSSGEDAAYSVAATAEYVCVTGVVDGWLPNHTANGGTDAFIRCYDTAGTVLWTEQFGTPSNDEGGTIALVDVGPYEGLYVAGTTGGTLPGGTPLGESDMFLARHNRVDGTRAWITQYGTEGGDAVSGLSTNGQGVFVAGTQESGGNLARFDAMGSIVWSTTFGDSAPTEGIEVRGLASTEDTLLVSGTVWGSLETTESFGLGDAFVIAYTTDGSRSWERQLGTTESDAGYGISVYDGATSDNTILIAGETSGSFPGNTSSGGMDAFLYALHQDGSDAWVTMTGTASFDTARGVSAGSDRAYLVGMTDGTFPGETNTGGFDAFITHVTWSNDYDEDSIDNNIDYYPVYPSNEFNDEASGGMTSGTVDSINDQTIIVTDAVEAEYGIDVTAEMSGGTIPATVSVCSPQATFSFTPGDEVVLTCGSVHATVVSGEVEAVFYTADDESVSGTIPEDTSLVFEPETNTFSADASNETTIELAFGSSTYVVEPGTSVTLETATNDTLAPIATSTDIALNPLLVGASTTIDALMSDSGRGENPITGAYVTIDGLSTSSMQAIDNAFDSPNEMVRAIIPAFMTPGVHNVCVFGVDGTGNVALPECLFLAVYDPEGGFVTGGGSVQVPAGSVVADQTLAGKATFGFVSKYLHGAQTPSGQTEFRMRVANMAFKSTAYEWLVVAGARAQYKGTGTINGTGSYGFMLTGIDEARPGGGTEDRIRMKIWDHENNALVFDSAIGEQDTSTPQLPIQGNIIIHSD